ncbi:hypothetical protein DFR29_104205 [Tahibacter aquaticus]|uniref:Uncharacterized protein n=1 Tax=Tahibacter aquaticus TaxID=520092 RepID=A0A4R6Z2F8_9GAMM|nr:hypothetical protein [Tahibacter aquaticus]TDR45777.1 hypothetical protein DFR29_104205 [Tahibacter aquaticus]
MKRFITASSLLLLSAACGAQSLDNRDLVIMGSDAVVPFGGSTVLSAESLADASGAAIDGSWHLDGDPAKVGCLRAVGSSRCSSNVRGTRAEFLPPAAGSKLMSSRVEFVPVNGAKTATDIKAGPPAGLPINGWADGDTLPFVDQFTTFMKARCAGAGTIGVSKYGKVVLALGIGMKDGRNAETIYNPACGSDAADPFKPAAGEMQYNTPFMFGSVAKATSFATVRWALKRELGRNDIDVRLINQSANRLVSATRVSTGALRIDVWNIDAAGTFTRLGSHMPETVKDYSLVRMGDTRFVVITRDADNKLGMYGYAIDTAGNPIVTDTIAGVTEVKQVQVTAVINQRVVIGMRRSDDSLQVRSFKFETNGSLTQLDSETGGTARDLRLAALPGTSRVVGAVRLGSTDTIKFIVWDVDAAGQLSRIHETDLDNLYLDTNRFDLAALSSSRIVFGAQHGTQPVNLSVLSVGTGGAIASVGGTFHAGASDFRIDTLDATHFAVASKDANDNGSVQQFAIGTQGFPYKVGASVAGGKFVSMDVANASGAGWGAGFVTAARDANDVLRLTSWDVTASSIAKLKLGTGANPVKDYAWNDADVEALNLVGFDFPNALLPARLHDIVAGYKQPPLHFDANDSRTDNSCVATQAPGYPFADARFKTIALRDFFSHHSGLNEGTVSAESLYRNNIDELRGLNNALDWNAEQNRLIDQWGAQNVQNARQAMGLSATVNTSSPDGFVVPRLDLIDLLVGSASMCLPNPQGTFAYSNTDPQWLRAIAEHVTGQAYTAPVGNPAAVEGTLLNDFTKSELGFGSNGFDAISARPAAMDAQGNDPWKGARPRAWQNATQSNYNQYWDVKRPSCKWQNGKCVFNDPNVGPTLNWNGDKSLVDLPMNSSAEGAATGGLQVQILPQLKFMSKYWSGGYDSGTVGPGVDPSIGEARNGVWTTSKSHDGSQGGAYAFAIQYGGNASCPGSEGVDVIVAVNQNNDKLCPNGGSCGGSDPYAYNQLKALMDQAVCAIDWTQVTPVPWLND